MEEVSHHGKTLLGNGSHGGGIPDNMTSSESDIFFFKNFLSVHSDLSGFGLPERSTDNSTGGVNRTHTHSVHDVHTVCSQARTNVNACLWLKMFELYHLCAPERIHLQVSHVTPMLVVSAPSHFQSTTARSTTWTARPSRRPHCAPTTTSARTSSASSNTNSS